MEFNLFIYFILLVLSLIVLFQKQKRTPYLKAGWFFTLLTFAYYAFPIIYILVWPESAKIKMYRTFSKDFTSQLIFILVICQLGFFIAEFFVPNGVKSYITKKKYLPIKAIYIYALLIITYGMFFSRYSSAGGFAKIITQQRRDYMNDVAASSGLFDRYDVVFFIVTALIIYSCMVSREFIKKQKLLLFVYTFFLILTILMGTRLLLLTAMVGLFSGLFLYHKTFLIKHRRMIIMGGVFLILAFSAFTTVRTELSNYFGGGTFNFDKAEVSFVPSELFTGILSHHSIENGVTINGITFLERIIPTSITNLIGIEKPPTYTQQIAKESFYSSGIAVYTVPYLSDLFFSVNRNLMLFLILNILLYLFFNTLQRRLVKYDMFFMLLFYVLIYYVLRVESPVWFARFYLSFIFLFFFYKLFKMNLVSAPKY